LTIFIAPFLSILAAQPRCHALESGEYNHLEI